MLSPAWDLGKHCTASSHGSSALSAVVTLFLSSVGKKLLLGLVRAPNREGKEHTMRIPREPFLKAPPTTAFLVHKLRFGTAVCSQLS